MHLNRGRARRLSKRNANINMTNLMDVMMVLLVVFMVAAPLMTSGIQLDLPKVGGGALSGKDTAVNISVDKGGNYYIGQSVIEPETIIEKIMAIKGENKDISITISGDAESNYGSVIGLMALLKDAGFSKVGLKTEPRAKK
jgi:biopolymer transport protein TolR